MINVKVTDRHGLAHSVGWEPAHSLMECLRDNDLRVLASCGGTASCSTCHVYIGESLFADLSDRSEDEQELLDDSEFYREDASRLSCQIAYSEELDGISVELAPEE